MTRRFYLTEAVNNVKDGITNVAPAHFSGSGVRWGAFRYGRDNVFLVLADVSDAQHQQLVSQQDVTYIVRYDNLDKTISNVRAVRDALEALDIPGNWIKTTHTWRDVLRIVAGCFQFQQRMNGLHKKSIFHGGLNLSRTWSSLQASARRDIRNAANSFGWDYSELTTNSTLRDVLHHMSKQWGDHPFKMAGWEL